MRVPFSCARIFFHSNLISQQNDSDTFSNKISDQFSKQRSDRKGHYSSHENFFRDLSKSELQIRHHSSVLFYPQNRLYPTIISAAAVITRKKVVGNIKAQVMPKPTQNSMRPHNRFISILPKRNVYDRLCGLKSNDSQIQQFPGSLQGFCFIVFISLSPSQLPSSPLLPPRPE